MAKNGWAAAVTIWLFGEGAALKGDFHAGLKYGCCVHCPVIFFLS